MAKGTVFKKEIADKILSTFSGSFLYNDGKEIRIPGMEDGQLIQIKVALTCAKDNVNVGEDNALPGEISEVAPTISVENTQEQSTEPVKIGQEEKDNIKNLMNVLGL